MTPTLVEKAVKGEPYLYIHWPDGRRELQVGKICNWVKSHGLIRVNRREAVSPAAISGIEDSHINLTTGQMLKASRRMLPLIHSRYN